MAKKTDKEEVVTTQEETKVEKKEDVFKDLDKIIAKEFDTIVDLSKVDTKVSKWIDTGVYALNYACTKNLFRGLPFGRISSVDGLNSTGKSLLLASAMRDPIVDMVILFDTEGGGNAAELMDFVGVDRSKVRLVKGVKTFSNYRISKKNTETIEEISDKAFPKNKDTPEWVYVEGLTRIMKRFINAISSRFNVYYLFLVWVLVSPSRFDGFCGGFRRLNGCCCRSCFWCRLRFFHCNLTNGFFNLLNLHIEHIRGNLHHGSF
jgi:hypothetical protein